MLGVSGVIDVLGDLAEIYDRDERASEGVIRILCAIESLQSVVYRPELPRTVPNGPCARCEGIGGRVLGEAYMRHEMGQ